MFGFKKKIEVEQYDKIEKQAAIRVSICTGEQVAGFKDRETGRFQEVMLIRNEADKSYFMEKYGVLEEELVKEY